MRWKHALIGILIITAVIWLPTGTPEDLFTTIPLINLLGFWAYFIVAVILVIGLWKFGILGKLLR